MRDLIKKIAEAIGKILHLAPPVPPRAAPSTPSVGDVHYRGKALFPNQAIWLNRDAGQDDGDVTYMETNGNGKKKKKFTTRAIWNASVADTKYEIK